MAIIHNLIARFRADTGSFDRKVKKSRSHMTRFGKDVQRMGKQMLALAGISGGIYALKRGLISIVKVSMEQEKSERLLRAATGKSIESFKRYASEIQSLTIYGDELILSQMAYAKNLGVSNDQLKEATTAAVGLAAKYRLDLATSMMLVGRASQGQTQMLTRYGIVLDESLSAQDKFNAVLKIGAEAFKLAEEDARSNESAMIRLKNEIGDLAETIGGPMADAMAKSARESTKYFSEHKAGFARYISDIEEGTQMWWNFWKAVAGKTPAGLIINKLRGGKNIKSTLPTAAAAKADFWDEMSKGLDKTNIATLKSADIIRQKYLPALITEIELTGRIGEAREHSRQVMKLENELKAKGLKKTETGIRLMKEQRALLKDLEKAQRLVKIADDIGDSFAGAFEDIVFEAKKLKDVLNALFRDITRSVMRNLITQPLGMMISGAIGGMFGMTKVTVAHSGGKVGSIAATRRVPAMAFAGAPRLHGGLANDEYPAILQRGEQVIPRGGGGMAPTIIVNNNTGQKMRQEGETMFDGKQWVIRIVTDDIQQGGPLRKMVQGLR